MLGQPDTRPYILHSDEDAPGGLYITFNLERTQAVQFTLVDLLGRQITHHEWTDVIDQTFRVEVSDSSNRVFIVRLYIDKKYYTNKVYLSK